MTTRLLPAADWPRRLKGTELEVASRYLDPTQSAIVVVEGEDGAILACHAVTWYCHVEGLWLDPALRNTRRGVLAMQRLWTGVCQTANALGAQAVITHALTDNVRDLIARAHGQRLPGESWVIPIGGARCPQPFPF